MEQRPSPAQRPQPSSELLRDDVIPTEMHLRASEIPFTRKELLASIANTAGHTDVLGLSVYDIVDQAFRRVDAFYAWYNTLDSELGDKVDREYASFHEKEEAAFKCLMFGAQSCHRSLKLKADLDVVKRLLELLMNKELPKLLPPDDLITACIMAWVVINNGLEWRFGMKGRIAWNAEFLESLEMDALRLHLSIENDGSNRTNQPAEFKQIHQDLLDLFTLHCDIKPRSSHYSLSELVEFVASQFLALKGLKSAVSLFLPCSPEVLPDDPKVHIHPLVVHPDNEPSNASGRPLEDAIEMPLQAMSLGASPFGDMTDPGGLYGEYTRSIPMSTGSVSVSKASITTEPRSQSSPPGIPDISHHVLPTIPDMEGPYAEDMSVPSLSNTSNISNALRFSGTAGINKRTVFVFTLEPSELSKGPYSSLLNLISALANIELVSTFKELSRQLDSFPDAVLILEPTITCSAFPLAPLRLSKYVVAGGIVIFGSIFRTARQQADMGAYFPCHWGLSWKAGSLHRAAFSLSPRPHADPRFTDKKRLLTSYSMEALSVSGIKPEDAVYVAQTELASDSAKTTHECPIALTQVGQGFVGYVGDLNVENGSIEVYLVMLGLRGT